MKDTTTRLQKVQLKIFLDIFSGDVCGANENMPKKHGCKHILCLNPKNNHIYYCKFLMKNFKKKIFQIIVCFITVFINLGYLLSKYDRLVGKFFFKQSKNINNSKTNVKEFLKKKILVIEDSNNNITSEGIDINGASNLDKYLTSFSFGWRRLAGEKHFGNFHNISKFDFGDQQGKEYKL